MRKGAVLIGGTGGFRVDMSDFKWVPNKSPNTWNHRNNTGAKTPPSTTVSTFVPLWSCSPAKTAPLIRGHARAKTPRRSRLSVRC